LFCVVAKAFLALRKVLIIRLTIFGKELQASGGVMR